MHVLLVFSDSIKSIERIPATAAMDSGVGACSQGPVIEAAGTTPYRTPFVPEGLEAHPFWSSAKAETLGNPPPYTDGPSRVIVANDGSKDCLALLLTPNLVAALNQITHDIRALERQNEALEKLESGIVDLARKADNVEAAIKNPRYREQAEEMQLALEILGLKRQDADECRSQLKIEQAPFENSLEVSRYQSHTMFEEALLEACLLDPPEPGNSPTVHEEDDDVSIGDFSVAPSVYEGAERTPGQQLLRDARMDVIGSYDALKTCQARLDDRHADYERQLADFQRSRAGFAGARTHFDHRHIQHVRNLTRDLVSAEQVYRAGKARVRTLESPAVPDGFDPDRTGDDGFAAPGVDRGRIEAWMCGVVPGRDGEIPGDRGDRDGWDAGPVEVMDSVSVMDRGEYVDEIHDWREHCRGLREKGQSFGRE